MRIASIGRAPSKPKVVEKKVSANKNEVSVGQGSASISLGSGKPAYHDIDSTTKGIEPVRIIEPLRDICLRIFGLLDANPKFSVAKLCWFKEEGKMVDGIWIPTFDNCIRTAHSLGWNLASGYSRLFSGECLVRFHKITDRRCSGLLDSVIGQSFLICSAVSIESILRLELALEDRRLAGLRR